jgi:hypothetical protein
MQKPKFKYIETYMGQDIFIRRYSRQWWWKVIAYSGREISNFTSSEGYFSMNSAINKARKYIDNKLV